MGNEESTADSAQQDPQDNHLLGGAAMPEQNAPVCMERKLAAIFSTDVAGYSRLMGDDERPPSAPSRRTVPLSSSLTQHYRGEWSIHPR